MAARGRSRRAVRSPCCARRRAPPSERTTEARMSERPGISRRQALISGSLAVTVPLLPAGGRRLPAVGRPDSAAHQQRAPAASGRGEQQARWSSRPSRWWRGGRAGLICSAWGPTTRCTTRPGSAAAGSPSGNTWGKVQQPARRRGLGAGPARHIRPRHRRRHVPQGLARPQLAAPVGKPRREVQHPARAVSDVARPVSGRWGQGFLATPASDSTSSGRPKGLGSGRQRVTDTTPGSTSVRPSKNPAICSGLRRWYAAAPPSS